MTDNPEFRIGVLASGGGSTFEAVQDAIGANELPNTTIAFVACNNGPNSSNAGVWERADRLDIPIHHISNKTEKACTLPEIDGNEVEGTISYEASEKLVQLADEYGVSIFVALGFMKKIIGKVLEEVPIANTHPGPLPETQGFHGTGVQEQVMQLGLEHSGPTFHWMDTRLDKNGLPAYDTGASIGHQPVTVSPEMQQEWEQFGTVNKLKNEVMRVEKLWVPTWIHKALGEVNG